MDALSALDWGVQSSELESFPPGKSPDEIASIVAEQGEELGGFARSKATDLTCELEAAGPALGPVEEVVEEVVDEVVEEVWADDLVEVVDEAMIEEVASELGVVEASFIGANLLEDSVVELTPDELIEDEASEGFPVEISFNKLLEARPDLEDMDTIRPMPIRRAPRRVPHAVASLPPHANPRRRVPRSQWSLLDETTATDLFVA
ncbi:MAG: hypothetical protein AAF721_24500 [Myxococcota bacterium]